MYEEFTFFLYSYNGSTIGGYASILINFYRFKGNFTNSLSYCPPTVTPDTIEEESTWWKKAKKK